MGGELIADDYTKDFFIIVRCFGEGMIKIGCV